MKIVYQEAFNCFFLPEPDQLSTVLMINYLDGSLSLSLIGQGFISHLGVLQWPARSPDLAI